MDMMAVWMILWTELTLAGVTFLLFFLLAVFWMLEFWERTFRALYASELPNEPLFENEDWYYWYLETGGKQHWRSSWACAVSGGHKFLFGNQNCSKCGWW